jgi:hypothetical protein
MIEEHGGTQVGMVAHTPYSGLNTTQIGLKWKETHCKSYLGKRRARAATVLAHNGDLPFFKL